jgi:dephospho-CoA kinase
MIVGKPDALKRLEAIVHPLVRDVERRFLKTQHDQGAAMVVLEIPLLFETEGDSLVEVTIVVSAPLAEQRRRVVERPGMTLEKLEAVLARQMPDAEKRQRAHFIVDTGGTIEASHAQVDAIIAALRIVKGHAYERFWRD